ncbi:MAG: hypothetical protein M1819_001848 [Sarea resinae]|nr:MAG: hypothetical protein M1819_001848 [Sarea resinae]
MISSTSRRLLSQASRTPRRFLASSQPANLARPFHASSRSCHPRKDDQDRNSINTESTEYSKTGSDAESAHMDDAAYNPKKTDPGSELHSADKESGAEPNPLDVSPANPEVSKQRDPTEGGAESGTANERGRSSGRGSPAKGKDTK